MIAVVSVTYFVSSAIASYYKGRGKQLPPDPHLRARLDEIEGRLNRMEPRLDNLETIATDGELDLAKRIADMERE